MGLREKKTGEWECDMEDCDRTADVWWWEGDVPELPHEWCTYEVTGMGRTFVTYVYCCEEHRAQDREK